MKKAVLCMMLLLLGIGYTFAQNKAEIKFDKTTHNFGTFSEEDAVVTCTFTFTNVGKGPLVIHQAIASCGCTVPKYTQEPILPGKTGTVTYPAGQDGHRHRDLQRHRTLPRPLPQIHHPAHQCGDRDDTPLHRRRNDSQVR